MIEKLLIATRNAHKIREIRAVLDALPNLTIELLSLSDLDDPPDEPAEEGATFRDNGQAKATYYAQRTGMWCLADDSGLEVDALDGEPGVRSARYAGEGGDRQARDAANNRKLLAQLQTIPDEKRAARFVCAMCIADTKGAVQFRATGTLDGMIGQSPRGTSGFGYDPLVVMADGRTVAELTMEEKNARSHRGQATQQAAHWLQGQA
ncbi:MAG: RdgB/HAM1 family non-canonical purine NTP pyrophosphatase [Phycisphaerales bacterium]|nr:RdgB/HAM1 family non-canonical purine NTP pyrophosphatase [Phycisphaerales bacterium]